MFVASEIVELGVQIEINGRDFYSVLAKKARDKKAKEIFSFLAGEEEKHIERFREILKGFHEYEPKEAYPEEYFSYMNALAGEYIFTKGNKGKEIAEKTKDEKEAIELGISFEKDSVKFYDGMKKIVPDKDQSIIDKLIQEEKNHVKKLEELWSLYGKTS